MDNSLQRLKGLGLLLALLTLPVGMPQAADGEIVISRPVQARLATRAPLAIDQHPNSAYASPNHYTDLSQLGKQQQGELSDADFAGVNTGRNLVNQLRGVQTSTLGTGNGVDLLQQRSGGGASHRGGGNSSGLGGQINRSLQQSLQPLKSLGGQ